MIIFLYGPDTYRSKQKLSALKQKFISQKDKQGLSTSTLDANSLTVDTLRKTVLSSGLFAEKRLTIIEGLLKNDLNARLNEQFDAVIKETVHIIKKIKDNILVFWDEEIKQTKLTKAQKQLYNALKKTKYAQCFELLKPAQTKAWIKKEIEKNELKIEQTAINLLFDIYANNLWKLRNELDKLTAAQQSKRSIIRKNDVERIVIPKIEQSIWQLIDALGQKNKTLAAKLLSDQFRSGTNIDYLISMLVYQYRIIFRIKSYIKTNKGFNPYYLAKKLSLHPFVCQKGLLQQNNYTLEELKKIYHQLLTIDLLRKTRSIDPEILLDLLIVKV